MERDFLGLSSKEPLAVVKEEVITDGCKEIGSGMHWPFSNKVSALPHLMSFKVGQEDKTKKFVSDPLVSSGFMSISTADAYDASQKLSMAEIPKPFNLDWQGGTNFSLTAYPAQQRDVHSVHHPHDTKMLPVSNHAVSISMNNPFSKNHYATTSQNMAGNTLKPQLLGAVPVTGQHAILPTIGSIAGATESCVKPSGSPAQLTIFYAGTVNVYDDITPEKAQAIMFLAGNGSSISSKIAQPKGHVLAPGSKPAAANVNPVNQPLTTPPSSCLSSPLSVSSPTGTVSGSGSTSTEETMAMKTTGAVTPPVSKLEPPKIASAMASVSATSMIPSVPQARKASLARFLEKRKERVMNATPYNLSKKSPETASAESNGMNFSATSAVGTVSLCASKESNHDM